MRANILNSKRKCAHWIRFQNETCLHLHGIIIFLDQILGFISSSVCKQNMLTHFIQNHQRHIQSSCAIGQRNFCERYRYEYASASEASSSRMALVSGISGFSKRISFTPLPSPRLMVTLNGSGSPINFAHSHDL
jgi:hypothetical protein